MERRTFAALAGASLLLGMAGCDEEPKPSPTATLLDNDKVHEAMKNLVDAVDARESDVGDFDSENWREVVPNVKTAASEVSDAVDELRKALGYES
jgi:hypothetical protein